MFKKIKSSLSLTIFAAILSALPAKAADKILLTYGPLGFSLPVASLEAYAKNGTVDSELSFYLNNLSSKDRETFKEVLTKKIPLDPVMTSRFLNSAIGERFMSNIGSLMTIEGNINGKYAIRGAIVQAAFEPQGFTLLGFFKKFPTNIQFQGEKLLGFSKGVSLITQATDLLVDKMHQWTADESSLVKPPVDFAAMPDLRRPGKYQFTKEIWQLNDSARNRQLYVILYKPIVTTEQKIPVIVFSHGFASKPEDFQGQAQHAASYGFLVALPQHPGSDYQYAKDTLEGYHRNTFDVNEFINRPLDLSYVLDELGRRNQSQFAGKLNLDSVGAFGHSFGGYTVFALAGARIDFDYLSEQCSKDYGMFDNALLLECRALELPRKDYNFRDKRVVAVMALNPVNRAIYGEKGINEVNIPVLIGSGSYDPATPPIFEQIKTFTWLKEPIKYLVLAEGQAHVDFSKMDAGLTSAVESMANVKLPDPADLHNYFYALSTAFSQVYLSQNKDYLPYLNASYAQYLSKGDKFKLGFISAASSEKLSQQIESFKAANNIQR